MRTSVSGMGVTAFAVGVLLLAAACGSSPPTRRAALATSAPVTNTATYSSTDRTSTATSTSPSGKTSITPTSTATTATSPTPAARPTAKQIAPVSPPLMGRVVSRLTTGGKVVALTFDAGANGDGVDSILATLAREKVLATFFLTGDFVDGDPTLARRISAAGRLGNHTTNHPHLPALTLAQVQTQITGAGTTILRVTGQDPRPLFRFPFGDSSPRDLQLVNALGYTAVGWSVDTLGWQGTSGGRSVDSVVQRVLAAAEPGEIVLMHVGSHPTDHSTLDADALPRVISELRARGYGFVTLNAMVR